MSTDTDLNDELSPTKLPLPAHPHVLEIKAEPFVDHDGADSLQVLVTIDENEDLNTLKGTDVIELKNAIRTRIRELGIPEFAYISLAKPSELAESD
jgi:hypothetical protein